jgi:hypothetical protein
MKTLIIKIHVMLIAWKIHRNNDRLIRCNNQVISLEKQSALINQRNQLLYMGLAHAERKLLIEKEGHARREIVQPCKIQNTARRKPCAIKYLQSSKQPG